MPKRESSSLILQNLKKRDLSRLGEPVVPMLEAEQRVAFGSTQDTKSDSKIDSKPASYHDSSLLPSLLLAPSQKTRLRPKERAARSALIVRLDPGLHRRLDEVARHNRLTMNDIVTEAIELHLQNFPQPNA